MGHERDGFFKKNMTVVWNSTPVNNKYSEAPAEHALGIPVCYNGMSGCELKKGTQGIITDTSTHWVKVRFPTKEVWYTAAQLAPCRKEAANNVK